MLDLDKAVAQVVSSYTAAVHAKDVHAFMQLYDADARIFDTWGVWSYESAAAWERAVNEWLTSLGSERVRVTFDDVKSSAGSELAYVSAIVTYASLAPNGDELRSMQNRLSWVLKVDHGGLTILHEHTSAPVGFEDMKAILSR